MPEKNKHSVSLNSRLCKGCVNCIKHCPTEAIRIRAGKAIIIEEKCIDCGECIRHCPNHAQIVETNSLSALDDFPINIAIVSPVLYAQFSTDTDIDSILQACIAIGFDDVYEVARSNEYVSLAIEDYVANYTDVRKPLISISCPTITRLVQMKFPELVKQLLPIMPPIELAVRQARVKAAKDFAIAPEKVGIWLISSCPAMVTMVKKLGEEINGVFSVAKIYGDVCRKIDDADPNGKTASSSSFGIGYCVAGGSVRSTGIVNALVVDGIHEVMDVLEQISINKMQDIDYIECSSCVGGCVGGVLNAENKFVAEKNLKLKIRALRDDEKILRKQVLNDSTGKEELLVDPNQYKQPKAKPVMKLDENIILAMRKLQEIEKILSELPGLDCGSCGAPSCQSLAEDIVQGKASESDCVFKLRSRVDVLAEEMLELSNKVNAGKE